MSDVTKGFRDGRFLSLSERDQRDVLKLMARVAEQAYRRGAQQGAGLAWRPSFRADLGEWRYAPALDLSPWLDRPRLTTSLERLDGECGEELRRIGLPIKEAYRGLRELRPGLSPGDASCGRAIRENSARSSKLIPATRARQAVSAAPAPYDSARG